MLKIFYDDCYEGNSLLIQLEKDNKIKKMGDNSDISLINPLYLDEVEKKLSDDSEGDCCIEELTGYMQEQFTDYNYDSKMAVNSLWGNPFSINISVPVEILTDGNEPEIYDYEEEIYNSDNPYKIICKKIDDLGKSILASQLKEMLEQVEYASFKLV